MVSKAKRNSAVAAPVAPSEPASIGNHRETFGIGPAEIAPFVDFRIQKVGRHYNAYRWQAGQPRSPGKWMPLFADATILSSVLGALERDISDAAVKL